MAAPDPRSAGDLGDSQGLDRLYRDHAAWLGAALTRRLGALAAEAEDIVQETYMRVARYVGEGAVVHPRALLLTIAGNLARDRARGAARRGHIVRGDEAALVLNRLGVPGCQEQDMLLKQLVLTLPEPLRDVFVLSRFTGMSYEDIASHFGLSVKTVEWRMSKALALCASRLSD